MKEKIKVNEITNELREAYLDYALSVIISRALPDVRDGLKPVQRRILYVMRELGLWPNEKFTKCANIVGNTIARYHPHGDQAVYEALVRLAQDFTMRYPIVWGQGNFGSIDGDPPAAYRYCVTGDTLILTNRCLEKIGEIANKEDIEELNLKVLSFNKQINKASKWFDSGIHPVIKIKTYRGYSLEGTYNHPILVLEKDLEGKPIFVWKTLSELKIGDYAVIDRSEEPLWPKEDIELKKFYPTIISDKIKIKKLPPKLNLQLAFFLGFAVAKGCIVESKDKVYKKLVLSIEGEKIFKKILKILKNNFEDLHIYWKKRKPSAFTKKPYYALEICSKYFIEFLENLGFKKCKADEKVVPQIIFEGTKKTVGAFLRGIFEGDGSIIFNNPKSSKIVYVSKSYNLIKVLQILLLRFGIASFLRYDGKKNYYFLLITGKKNIKLFAKYINFDSPHKIEKLKNFIKSTKGNAISHSDFIPFLSDYLRNKYKKLKIKWNYKEWLKKHNLDRYEKLRIYLPILRKFLQKEDISLIEFFLKNNYLFDRIVEKENNGFARVYSLKIESNCHSFVSNGFISHNTEAKLTSIAVEMLADIEKESVDFKPNYDNTRKEPIVLPAKIPQLLVNGTLGIAVGMATNIPPHNLTEVGNAIKKLIENPAITIKELLEVIKGPDFPTGGIIYGKKTLLEAYKSGRGGIVIRGKAIIEETKRSKRIVIQEIPWQVNKSELVRQIAELGLNKIIPEIKEVRDESNKEGIRIVIETSEKDDKFLNSVIERLYKLTDLQKNYYFNFIALEEGIQPKLFNLKDLLLSWINHRREVIRRRTRYDLERTKERIEILEGFKKALQDIDTVIKIIRTSADRETAKINLMKKLKINERQANAILEMPLRTLTSLETKRIIDELNEKLKLKEELETILKYPKKIDEIIIKETDELIKKFGDKRRTQIIEQDLVVSKEKEEIPEEDVLLFINTKRYVKTFKVDTPIEKIIKDKENFGKILLTKTTEKILAYTKKGKIYTVSVYDFYTSPKYLEANLIIDKNDEIIDILRPSGYKEILIFTKNGLGKKMKLEEVISNKRTGVQAIKLKNDDQVIKAILSKGEEIALISTDGFALGIKNELPVQKRISAGVKVIKLKNSFLFNASLMNKNFLVLVFSNGYFKKISIKEINIQKRGGKGIKVFDIKDKFGNLIFAECLNDDDIIFIDNQEIKSIKVKEIPLVKRINQPIKILDKISKVEIIQ